MNLPLNAITNIDYQIRLEGGSKTVITFNIMGTLPSVTVMRPENTLQLKYSNDKTKDYKGEEALLMIAGFEKIMPQWKTEQHSLPDKSDASRNV